jgi:protein-tyrosine phosphatase
VTAAARRVVAVCTGNIHRSPALEALLLSRAAREGLEEALMVESAGTHAAVGAPADEEIRGLLAARGVNLGDHRARQLRESVVASADLVVALADEHRRWLFHAFPQHLDRVVLLGELAGDGGDVADPIGGGRQAREAMVRRLETMLDAGWPRLLRRIRLGRR